MTFTVIDSFTLPTHINSDRFKKFCRKAYKINTEQKRSFWYPDFEDLDISNVLYRKYIQKIKDILEQIGNSKPKRWKFKGLKLIGDSHRFTLNPKRDGTKLLDLLYSLKYEQLYIHDIKVKFHSKLHDKLIQNRCTPNKSNKLITVDYPLSDNNLVVKINVYPNTTQIDIGCTFKPLVYDSSTIWSLHQLLSEISYYLQSLVSNTIDFPPTHEWIITHFHLNKDGSDEFSGEAFSFTIEDFNSGILRFYSKKFSDKIRLRLEKIITPQNSIAQEMNKIIFIRASDLEK